MTRPRRPQLGGAEGNEERAASPGHDLGSVGAHELEQPCREAGRIAAEHILSLGHRRIGFIFPPTTENDRARGRLEAAATVVSIVALFLVKPVSMSFNEFSRFLLKMDVVITDYDMPIAP